MHHQFSIYTFRTLLAYSKNMVSKRKRLPRAAIPKCAFPQKLGFALAENAITPNRNSSLPGHSHEQGVVQTGRQVLPAQSLPELRVLQVRGHCRTFAWKL